MMFIGKTCRQEIKDSSEIVTVLPDFPTNQFAFLVTA